jgi:O-antigen/teichoic acid export membrane protein
MPFSKKLYQNFVWRGLYFITTFILTVAIARTYQAQMSGWINYISNNFAFALTFGSLSLEAAVLYFGASGKIGKNKLFSFSICWSLTTSIIFYLVYTYFIDRDQAVVSKDLLKFAGIHYFAGILITNFFMNLFFMEEEFMLPNALLSILNIVLVLLIPNGIMNTSWMNQENYLYLYYFWCTLQAIVLVVAYCIHQKKIRLQLPNKKELQLLFRYASIAFTANLVFFLVYRMDYWFIDYYTKNELALGNYIQASKLGQMLLIFAIIVANTVFPYSAAVEGSRLIPKILVITRNFIFFFLLTFCVVLLVGKPILLFVFGNSFQLMFAPFIAILPGILFLSILTILSAYFGGQNKTSYNIWSSLVGLLVIGIGDILFIPKYGIIAAAIVSSIGYGAALLFALYKLHCIYPFPIKSLWTMQKNDFNWLLNLKRKEINQ